jgi:hypothetical protein
MERSAATVRICASKDSDVEGKDQHRRRWAWNCARLERTLEHGTFVGAPLTPRDLDDNQRDALATWKCSPCVLLLKTFTGSAVVVSRPRSVQTRLHTDTIWSSVKPDNSGESTIEQETTNEGRRMEHELTS